VAFIFAVGQVSLTAICSLLVSSTPQPLAHGATRESGSSHKPNLRQPAIVPLAAPASEMSTCCDLRSQPPSPSLFSPESDSQALAPQGCSRLEMNKGSVFGFAAGLTSLNGWHFFEI
jgi:hypothetical protein